MTEIADQLDGKPDVVVCSVGGGGLMNGIMQVIDERGWSDEVEVLATETKGADSLNQALRAGRLTTLSTMLSDPTYRALFSQMLKLHAGVSYWRSTKG